MSKNKTLIIYNQDGAECDTKFPICDIIDFYLCKDPDSKTAVIIDTKGERHIVVLEPTIKKDIIGEDGSFVEYHTTSFRVDV